MPPTSPDNYTFRPGLVSISSGNAVMSPIVQVSEHHQPLNVSTTISVLPETSHVNVSGMVQESFNASTSLGSGGNLQDHDISAQYQSQAFQQPQEHGTTSLSRDGHGQSTVWSLLSQVTDGPLEHSYDFKVTENLPHKFSHHIPFHGPTTGGPPPLISNLPPQNINPFYLKKLAGNIRICQGCRGSLRLADGMVPNPPYDVVIAHLEKRQFRDASGMLKIPAKHSAAHYHFCLACIRACDPNFLPTALHIPNDVAGLLSLQHHQHLQLEFGLQIVRHQDIVK